MSSAAAVPRDDGHAGRWRRWQAGSAASSRRSSVRMRIVFAVLLTAAIVWLGLELASSSMWT